MSQARLRTVTHQDIARLQPSLRDTTVSVVHCGGDCAGLVRDGGRGKDGRKVSLELGLVVFDQHAVVTSSIHKLLRTVEELDTV